MQDKIVEIAASEENIKQFLNSLTNNTLSMSQLRQEFFTKLQILLTLQVDKQWHVNRKLAIDKRIGLAMGEISAFLTSIELNPEARELFGQCLGVLAEARQIFNSAINETTDKYLKKLKLEKEISSDSAREIISGAYLSAINPICLIFESANKKIKAEPINVNDARMEELSYALHANKDELEYAKYDLILTSRSAAFKKLWADMQKAYQDWIDNTNPDTLNTFILSVYILNRFLHSQFNYIVGEDERFGADNMPVGRERFFFFLQQNNCDMSFKEPNPNHRETIKQVASHLFTMANKSYPEKLSEESLKKIWPATDYHNTEQLVKYSRSTLESFAAFTLYSIKDIFSYFPHVFGDFNENIDTSLESETHLSTVNAMLDVAKIHHEGFLIGFHAINDYEESISVKKKITSPPVPNLTQLATPSASQPVMELQNLEDQAAFRYRISKEKYTINPAETKLLLKAVKRALPVNVNIQQLVPTRSKADELSGIYSYESFINEIDAVITIANAKNKQWFRKGPFKIRTEHLKAARDFVEFMAHRYDTVTHPEKHLFENKHRNHNTIKDAFVFNLKTVKPHPTYTHKFNFLRTFTRVVGGLSSLFSSNRSLKNLGESYSRRKLQLDSLKLKTPRIPSKPITNKLSIRKRVKAEKAWLDKKGNHLTDTRNGLAVNKRFFELYGFTSAFKMGWDEADKNKYEKDKYIFEENPYAKLYDKSIECIQLNEKARKMDHTIFMAIQKRLVTIIDEDPTIAQDPNLSFSGEWPRLSAEEEAKVNETTAAEFDSMRSQINKFDELIAKLPLNEAEWSLEKLNNIFSQDNPLSADALLRHVKELHKTVRKLHDQSKQLMHGELAVNSESRSVQWLKEIYKACYLRAADRVVKRSELASNFNPEDNDSLSKIGKIISEMKAAKEEFKKMSGLYYEYLSAELDARKQLDSILEKIENKIKAQGEVTQDSVKDLLEEAYFQATSGLTNVHELGALDMQLSENRLQLICQTLEELKQQPATLVTIENYRKSNKLGIEELASIQLLEKGKIEAMSVSLTSNIQAIKHLAEHSTYQIKGAYANN